MCGLIYLSNWGQPAVCPLWMAEGIEKRIHTGGGGRVLRLNLLSRLPFRASLPGRAVVVVVGVR